MENATRISFSAITHIGSACMANDDRIYANGRFMRFYDSEHSSLSIEAGDRQFLFALSDGMHSEASGISISEDLKKLQERMKSSTREIQTKLEELADCVEQSNNLLHSVSLGESTEKIKKPAFAGVIIDGGYIAAVSMGSCRVYKLDGDTLKLMVNDYKRTERLLKMGIINDEQAELLANQYGTAGADTKSSVKKSDIFALREGTVYLICSKGLTESVNEDVIYDILATGGDADFIADRLVNEAVGNEAADNVTAMVIKVEEPGASENASIPGTRRIPSRNFSGRIDRLARNVKKRRLDVAKFTTTLIVFVVIAALVFGVFTLWLNFSGHKDKEAMGGNQTNETVGTTAPSETDPLVGDTAEGDEGVTGESGQSGEAGKDSSGAASGDTYTVKPGDSLMKISKQHYKDESKYKLIMEANNITNPDKIFVGQVLKLPPAE